VRFLLLGAVLTGFFTPLDRLREVHLEGHVGLWTISCTAIGIELVLIHTGEKWHARTRHGSKGGRRLPNMAPVAKTRYIRDADLKAL
jgi:hypothetical protein